MKSIALSSQSSPVSSLLRMFLPIVIVMLYSVDLFAQVRVAVLPVRNMDGNLGLNSYCYSLADSLRSALAASPGQGTTFTVVPSDSIEAVLAELNLDPTSPQYESDLWKSVALLKCDYAVTGSFNMNAGRMLLNMYTYDVTTKLPNSIHAATNIFKAPEKIHQMIGVIKDKLIPGFVKR